MKKPLPFLPLLSALSCLVLAPACSVLSYDSPTGERFSRRSFGAKTSISSLSVDFTTNGLRKVTLHGYQNDNSQALGTVTEAAVKAAVQGIK